MKVCLCAIAKNENRYIKEFVEYYKSLGIDKIFLYDNNDVNGESFSEILKDYINESFIEIFNFRGIKPKYFGDSIQLKAYNDCYYKYSSSYDWLCFFDVDEYLVLPTNFSNIKEWLSEYYFRNFGLIHINWMYYGDNELLYYEDKPLMERFTTPCKNNGSIESFFENKHIKSIVKGNIGNGVLWISTPHTPLTWVPCCDCEGIKKSCSFNPFSTPLFNSKRAFIKHFGTKTIEEYIEIKMKRGFPDQTMEDALNRINLNEFFRRNKWTEEKEKIGISLIKQNFNK